MKKLAYSILLLAAVSCAVQESSFIKTNVEFASAQIDNEIAVIEAACNHE